MAKAATAAGNPVRTSAAAHPTSRSTMQHACPATEGQNKFGLAKGAAGGCPQFRLDVPLEVHLGEVPGKGVARFSCHCLTVVTCLVATRSAHTGHWDIWNAQAADFDCTLWPLASDPNVEIPKSIASTATLIQLTANVVDRG